MYLGVLSYHVPVELSAMTSSLCNVLLCLITYIPLGILPRLPVLTHLTNQSRGSQTRGDLGETKMTIELVQSCNYSHFTMDCY